MGFREKKGIAAIFVVSMIFILAGYIYLYLRTISQTEEVQSYQIQANSQAQDNTSVTIDMSVSQQWEDTEFHPDNPIGAQYNGVISYQMKDSLHNWTIELPVPEDAVIDSAWNGIYEIKDGKIKITAVDYNELITPLKQETFGFVLYSKEIVDFQTIQVTGQKMIQITNSPIFHGLITASILWVLSLIAHIFVRVRTKKYVRKQREDSKIIMQSMNTFANMIDAKDPYTRGHSTRVAIYASEIANRMKLSADEAETLYYVALLHDCGKIGIPDMVLNKPHTLSSEEWQLIRSHTTLGSKVLVNFTAIKGIRDGALYHHERYDGQGYPAGLKGEDIPLYARIICIADSYDAMSSNRCYREQIAREKILSELKNNAGTQFDPDIVTHMIDMIQDGFTDIVQEKTQIFTPNYA